MTNEYVEPRLLTGEPGFAEAPPTSIISVMVTGHCSLIDDHNVTFGFQKIFFNLIILNNGIVKISTVVWNFILKASFHHI